MLSAIRFQTEHPKMRHRLTLCHHAQPDHLGYGVGGGVPGQQLHVQTLDSPRFATTGAVLGPDPSHMMPGQAATMPSCKKALSAPVFLLAAPSPSRLSLGRPVGGDTVLTP